MKPILLVIENSMIGMGTELLTQGIKQLAYRWGWAIVTQKCGFTKNNFFLYVEFEVVSIF